MDGGEGEEGVGEDADKNMGGCGLRFTWFSRISMDNKFSSPGIIFNRLSFHISDII